MTKINGDLSKLFSILILLSFILLKFILQYTLVNPVYDLQRDEYLHLDQANHLAWGYISVPPLSSWIAYIIRLLGNGIFWVRFFPALFGALTIVCVWHSVKKLNGGLYAQVLAATAITLSSLVRLNILFQPNSFEVLAWTFLFFSLISYIQSGKNKWLYYAGMAAGIGFLNKYNIVFPLMGIFTSLLLSPERKIFLNKHFYFAFLLALVITLPNIVWQMQNGFPVLQHMKELSTTQLVHNERMNFIKEQLLLFAGSLFLILIALSGLILYKQFRAYRFILYSFLFTILLYVYFRAKGYYAIGLYPVLLAFGAVYFEKLFSLKWKWHFRWVAIVIIVLMFIPLVQLAMPYKNPEMLQKNNTNMKELGLYRWEDGKEHVLPQDFADMLGWKELAFKTDSLYQTLSDKHQTLVLTDNYGQAGAINFYAAHIKNAVSFNADYATWFPEITSLKNIILIREAGNKIMNEEEKIFFKSIIVVDSVQNIYAREYNTRIILLQGIHPAIFTKLKEIARKERKKYMP